MGCHVFHVDPYLCMKRWLSDKANHICENMLQTVVCYSSSLIGNFLASADIKDFDRTSIGRTATYIIISLTLFTPRVFCLAYLFVNT